MRRATRIAVLLCLAFGVSTGGDSSLPCRPILLSDINWVASFDDDHPVTPENHASIVHDADESGEFYGMEWNSPEITDVSLIALDQLDRTGVTTIKLTLATSESMDVVVVVQVEGDYCNRTWRYASADAIQVGTETQEYELHVSEFTGDPFQGCVGALPEDALEQLGAIILLPESQAGELRVYEVGLCGEGIEPEAAAEPEDELPIDEPDTATRPVFTVDSDVTLDSVVQVGDGPQELSTNIKFYPNTRRIEPGETVYWTLEIGEESGLEPPFTIIPEMDNDMFREPGILTAEGSIVVEHTYTTANPYVPYVVIRDGAGTTRTVWTRNLLAVVPDIQHRKGVGIKLPTPESPVGDVINAGHVILIDHALFDRDSGHDYIRNEIEHWVNVGFNLAIIDIWWFVDDVKSNVLVPIYANSPQPHFWTGTMDLEDLVLLTDWLHEAGLRVSWRFALVEKGDHTTIARFDFAPTNLDLYVSSQLLAKPYYAAIAQQTGVELFGLDCENDAFTLEEASIAVVDAVRRVYTGPLFDSATGTGSRVAQSPLTPFLDLIFWSNDPHDFRLFESVDDMIGSFHHQYQTELLRPLFEFQKPGLVEVYVDGQINPQFQAKAYQAMLHVLKNEPSLLQGIAVFDLMLRPTWSNRMWTPIARPAERILSEYFNTIFPEQRIFDFTSVAGSPTEISMLADFDSVIPADSWISTRNGSATKRLDHSEAFRQGSSLRIDFTSTNTKGDWANAVSTFWFTSHMNWSEAFTLNFWYKSSAPSGSSILVSVFDSDGDRFTAELFITQKDVGEWALFTVDLEYLVHPSWAEHGNGQLDMRRIAKLELMEKFQDQANHTSWYDEIYLGGARE